MLSLHESGEAHTGRLNLSRPTPGDLEQLFTITSDPRVWTHYPSLRHTIPATTAESLERWIRDWHSDGLGPWVARLRGQAQVIGYGGCSIVGETIVNLGYRFAADEHGQGYATELARAAVKQAKQVKPDLPIVACLLEHNVASARVAQKLGMRLIHRGADAGNPDTAAMRLVYADRALSREELAVVVH